MWKWLTHHIAWLAIRFGVTLICCVVLQNLIRVETGQFIGLNTLLWAAALIIITVRFWTPKG